MYNPSIVANVNTYNFLGNSRFIPHAAFAITIGKISSIANLANIILKNKYTEEQSLAISEFLLYLKDRKHNNPVNMLKQMSRIPLKNPKTFDNYDFSRINGKNVDTLKELSTLSSLYAHKNIAFIGPQGVGKTHLVMASGRICCDNEYNAYFL